MVQRTFRHLGRYFLIQLKRFRAVRGAAGIRLERVPTRVSVPAVLTCGQDAFFLRNAVLHVASSATGKALNGHYTNLGMRFAL